MILQNIQNTLKPSGGSAIKLKNKKNDYSRLVRRIFTLMLLIIAFAIMIAFFLRTLLRGYFANGVVYFLEKIFYMSSEEAQTIYQFTFRNNIELLMFITITVFILLLFRFAIAWFTKYFDEISSGMDKLLEETDTEIILSPELDFMENKLNQIKNSLAQRKKDAQEAEQRKNDLVVYLAHDIKTPLTSVIGYLSLLDEAPDMPQEQNAKYIGITLDKAYRLEQLIDEFFEITRFNLNTIVLNMEQINLSFMLQQIADEFYPMLNPQGKQVAVHVPDGFTLWGDADKLARVFNNIFKNAIAYSQENSVIRISVVQQGENAVITFTNHGKPIPPSRLETIFEKFYRLDTARSANTGGAGLGLAIAKEIITAHGGVIIAESSQEKTVFSVSLPNLEIR